MADSHAEPRSVVVLAAGRCDLRTVDDLLRLRLAAARLGLSIRVTGVDDRLRELVELVGLADLLEP